MKRLYPVLHLQAFLRFLWFPSLSALLWGGLGFLAWMLWDGILLLFSGSPLGAWGLHWTTQLLFICLVSLAFEFFYYSARFLAALFSHLPGLVRHLLPGLSLFFLFLAPISELGRMLPFSEMGLGLLLFGTMLVAGGLVLALLWPEFHRNNIVFVLMAAGSAYCVASRLFSLDGPSSIREGALWTGIGSLLLFVLLYLNLQIRYRLQLAQGWEPVLLPRNAFGIATGIFSLFLMLYFMGAWMGLRAPLHYLIGLCAVLTLRWLLLARQAVSPIHKSLLRVLYGVQRQALILVPFLLVAALGLFWMRRPAPSLIAALQEAKTGSGLHLSLAGSLLDADGDRNSYWPGGDPDDHDPCIRADSKGHCAEPHGSLLAQFSRLRHSAHGDIRIPKLGAKKSVVFLSILVPEGSSGNPRYFLFGESRHWKNRLLASDRPPRALAALLYEEDGLSAALHKERGKAGYPSLLAGLGYRTFCFAEIDRRAIERHRLHKGCQIVPTKIESREELHQKYLAYRERHNFLWLHFDFRRTPAGEIAQAIRQEKERWSKDGELILLLMQEGRTIARLYDPKGESKEGFLDLGRLLATKGVLKGPSPPKREGIGSLSHSPLESPPLWAGTSARLLPRNLYAKDADETDERLPPPVTGNRNKRLFSESNAKKTSAFRLRWALIRESQTGRGATKRLPRYTYRYKDSRIYYFDALSGALKEEAFPRELSDKAL